MASKFSLGQVCCTPGAARTLDDAGVSVFSLLRQHQAGDWGEMDAEDWQSNEDALEGSGRLFSAYVLPTGEKVWVITEWDRSLTTLLLPDEY